jgi:hypothetical protein
MTDNATLMQNALYCAAYCEENVWHLLGEMIEAKVPSQAVIVTNPTASVLYFQQRAAPESYLCWDYHVFAKSADCVLDLDHRDGIPISVADYLAGSFPAANGWPDDLRPRFLSLAATDYRLRFSSDRRHMQRGGAWLVPPPSWPCTGEGHNLAELLEEARETGRPLEQWP